MGKRMGRVESAQAILAEVSCTRHLPEVAAAMIAGAQVHATLALVEATEKLAEQQRLANIIALASFRVGASDLPAMRHLIVEPVGSDWLRPSERMREGLGLNDG
jgi:hypothetical protein